MVDLNVPQKVQRLLSTNSAAELNITVGGGPNKGKTISGPGNPDAFLLWIWGSKTISSAELGTSIPQ